MIAFQLKAVMEDLLTAEGNIVGAFWGKVKSQRRDSLIV